MTIAGLTDGDTCLCEINVFELKSQNLESTICEKTCSGDKRMKCGGDEAIHIHQIQQVHQGN